MIKLFTHTDLDGIGCAILAKLAYGEKIDIEFCNYDDINERVSKFYLEDGGYNKECHITDISISEDLARIIDENGPKIMLLDHHQTALELNKYSWCTVKEIDEDTGLKTCGTEMYYDWLVKQDDLLGTDSLAQFVSLIKDYDTWRWATLGDVGLLSKQLNDLLYIYGRENFIEICLEKLKAEDYFVFSEVDMTLLENRQREIDTYIDVKNSKMIIKKAPIGGIERIFGVIFVDRFHSEVGNRLSEMHPELDFIMMLDTDGKISFRTTKNDLELGREIAVWFNGGGHPKAAGGYFDADLVGNLVNEIVVAGNVESKCAHPHQKLVDYVKISADSIKKNAESIVGSEKNLRDLDVIIRINSNEAPEINVDRTFYPENWMKM